MNEYQREKISCPGCQNKTLKATTLACGSCGIEISGQFQENEFVSLPSEDLHFLRVFVHCEGKIKDVEKALGISYPSVKSKLQSLRIKLAKKVETEDLSIPEILEKMNNQEIDYQAGLSLIKKIKGGKNA